MPGKDPEDRQRETLDILTLGVPVSTHPQSKLKPRVSRTLPEAEKEKDLRALPSILTPDCH